MERDEMLQKAIDTAGLEEIQDWEALAVLRGFYNNTSWRASYLFSEGFKDNLKELDLSPIHSSVENDWKEEYDNWLKFARWLKVNMQDMDILRMSSSLFGDEGGPVVIFVLVKKDSKELEKLWHDTMVGNGGIEDWSRFWAGEMGLSQIKKEDVRYLYTTAM